MISLFSAPSHEVTRVRVRPAQDPIGSGESVLGDFLDDSLRKGRVMSTSALTIPTTGINPANTWSHGRMGQSAAPIAPSKNCRVAIPHLQLEATPASPCLLRVDVLKEVKRSQRQGGRQCLCRWRERGSYQHRCGASSCMCCCPRGSSCRLQRQGWAAISIAHCDCTGC